MESVKIRQQHFNMLTHFFSPQFDPHQHPSAVNYVGTLLVCMSLGPFNTYQFNFSFKELILSGKLCFLFDFGLNVDAPDQI